MNIAELIERLQLQQEGRLEYQTECGNFLPAHSGGPYYPHIGSIASKLRCRPEPPPMPDEVWLDPNHEWMNGSRIAKEQKDSIRTVRYIRAGAVIPASQLEWKTRNSPEWMPACGLEYRIKP